MIEILLKNKEIIKAKSVDEILNQHLDFHIMQFIDYTDEEINWVEQKFGMPFLVFNFKVRMIQL